MLGKKVGTEISKRMNLQHMITLNDNKIDYIHWDIPMKLWIVGNCSKSRTRWAMITRFCPLLRNFAKLV